MSGFQVLVVTICFLINMLDGFDVLVMGFTAHSISEEWLLDGKSLGVLFSSGLVGMAIGAIFLGRLADKYGRRALIILCLSIMTCGMLFSAFTENLYQLSAMRVLTGLGIGGALATVNIITAEYSSNKRRGLMIALIQIGYPIGGMIAAVVTATLIPEAGWRSVFIFGASLSAIMIPVVIWRMPESIDYILSSRPVDALDRINLLLKRMGHNAIAALPDADSLKVKIKGSLGSLWASDYRNATILIWLGFFMIMASLYFVLSWTPKLLILAGLSEDQGISGGMILHIGGMLGQVAFGFISAKFKLKKLAAVYMFTAVLSMCLFAVFFNDLNFLMYLGFSVGFFLFGSITSLYILVPSLCPAEIRTTGMGAGIGVGRIGAILSPTITGVLLDMGWQTSSLFVIFTVPMLIAMMAILFIRTDHINPAL